MIYEPICTWADYERLNRDWLTEVPDDVKPHIKSVVECLMETRERLNKMSDALGVIEALAAKSEKV
jgi:hypothetical protein